MQMQISEEKEVKKEKGLTLMDAACGCAACACRRRWGTWTCWCSDTLHVRADGLPMDTDKCKEKRKRNIPVGTRMCCMYVRMHCMRMCWCADAHDCKRKEKKTERKKRKLTKYKSWHTDLCADTLHGCVGVRMRCMWIGDACGRE